MIWRYSLSKKFQIDFLVIDILSLLRICTKYSDKYWYKWLIEQKIRNVQTHTHLGMIKLPSCSDYPLQSICISISTSSLREGHTMCATVLSLQASAKEEEELRVSWRKPASEQVSLLPSDSELSCTGFVKPKTQSFLQLSVN